MVSRPVHKEARPVFESYNRRIDARCVVTVMVMVMVMVMLMLVVVIICDWQSRCHQLIQTSEMMNSDIEKLEVKICRYELAETSTVDHSVRDLSSPSRSTLSCQCSSHQQVATVSFRHIGRHKRGKGKVNVNVDLHSASL